MRDMARAARMAAYFRAGETYEQIGCRFGVSRQRVQQILKAGFGISAADGGIRQAASQRAAQAAAEAAEAVRKYTRNVYGCSVEQFQALKADPSRPLDAYRHQRYNARRRGIPFRLSVGEWWQIWQDSGHWDERGRGHGFAMCRRGDSGAYEVGNVFIATQAWNAHEGKRAAVVRPPGVDVDRDGRYRAVVRTGGRYDVLGHFDTPKQAAVAFAASSDDETLKKHAVSAAFSDCAALRRWRREQGVTVYGAAYKLGVAERTWRQWEEGRRAIPLTVARRLADLVGVPAHRLTPEFERVA